MANFFLLAGPCQLESLEHALFMSKELTNITNELGLDFYYKTSFDKANRTSVSTKRGIGLADALPIFDQIRDEVGCKIITDVHEPHQCDLLKDHVDALQIPAFLCRQTDLLIAAGNTQLPVNVKKGQFLAPWDMKHVADKIASTGNKNIWLCERGTSFGYNTLVSDFRSLPIMSETGYPVVFDATHSVQQPGGQGTTSGGQRQYVPILAKAAVAVGIDGLFIEVHEDPDNAPSDGPNMVHLKDLKNLLQTLLKIHNIDK